MCLVDLSPREKYLHTEIRGSSRTFHHASHNGHGFPSRGRTEELSALVKIIECTVDFYEQVSKDADQSVVRLNAWDSFPRAPK